VGYRKPLPDDGQSHLQEIVPEIGNSNFGRYICSAQFGLYIVRIWSVFTAGPPTEHPAIAFALPSFPMSYSVFPSPNMAMIRGKEYEC